jgi:hypothetical protein
MYYLYVYLTINYRFMPCGGGFRVIILRYIYERTFINS